VEKRVNKESKLINKQLFHLQVQRFTSIEQATKTVQKIAKKWNLHQLEEPKITEHKVYETKGRPKKGQKPNKIQYQILVNISPDEAKIKHVKAIEAHYIVGSNTDKEALSDTEVVEAYKKQHYVERGFRFLKDPLFFASSLFVKAPRRIMGLLMIMLLSLLVYGIAERRMRNALKEQDQTLPNQIHKQVQNPTLRWLFQLLYGINYVKVITNKTVKYIIENNANLRHKYYF
jgi:transposase